MNVTFNADGNFSAQSGGGLHRIRGRVTIVVGSPLHQDMGGGTLSAILKLENGEDKVVATFASPGTKFVKDCGAGGLDLVLSGATSPDLYCQMN